MLTGSFVSSLQGEPRSSVDIDIVVNFPGKYARYLTKSFPSPEYYLDEESILEAVDSGGSFNLIDLNGGDKVDFFMLTNGSFDKSRFKRKISYKIWNSKIYVSSPEDTILAKMKWAELSGGSQKQLNDALGVYEVQSDMLDQQYLDDWAKRLDVYAYLQEIRKKAE